MVAALCEAMLLAMAVAGLTGSLRTRLAVWSLAVTAALGAYGIVHGVPTWRAPAVYADTYAPLALDRGDWRIATTPFFQSWMSAGPALGSDLALAADLGLTSSMWHGHASLGRGGWDPRAARYVEFLYELTKEGTNRGMSKLLGVAGVKYVGVNPYQPLEVARNQNRYFRTLAGLELVSARGGIGIYRNAYALPQAFQTRKTCLIAGGYAVLGDLAADPLFDPRRVSVQFADQIRALGGAGALRRVLAQDRCVVVGAGGAAAMNVLLHAVDLRPLVALGDPSWARGAMRVTYDIGAEPRDGVSVPSGGVVEPTLVAPTDGAYRVWVAALVAPDRGSLGITVDGKTAGAIHLGSPAGTGVRWRASSVVALRAGPQQVTLTSLGRAAQKPATLTEIALVPADAHWRPSPATQTIVETGAAGPLATVDATPVRSLVGGPWTGLQAQKQVVVGATGASGATVRVVRPNRPYYTVAYAPTVERIDPMRPFGIRFAGAGSGAILYLNLQFDDGGEQVVGFRFADTTTRKRLITFLPAEPSFARAVPRWDHVRRVTLSINSKRTFARELEIEGPFQLRGPTLRPQFSAGGAGDPFASAPPGAVALDPVTQQVGVSARVTVHDPGLLVFSQAYHPAWRLDAPASHEIAFGFANAYRVTQPAERASLSFTGARWGRIGTWISAVVWVGALLALTFRLRPRKA
jgi:hypothetical protein